MNRGTTPTHTFRIPSSVYPTIKEIKIIYSQNGRKILQKKTSEITLEGGNAIVKLTQKETFLFSHAMDVEIQVRVLTQADDAINSDIITRKVWDCLDNEVLV
jgi:hypothetical protein